MSDRDGDQGPQRRAGRRRLGWTAVRLGVLLAILAALVVYLTLPGGAPRHSRRRLRRGEVGAGSRAGARRTRSATLRETVARVLPQRVGRLYEEGTVRASVAWTDEEPGAAGALAAAKRPAGRL